MAEKEGCCGGKGHKHEPTESEKERGEGYGQMTVQEAGELGGHKGGQKVKRLIEEGKEEEAEGS